MTVLTEEEAKKKWCPMRSFRDVAQSNLDLRCIASECMAWRWVEREPRETRRVYKGETHTDGAPIVRAGTLVVINGESWRYEYSDVDEKGEFDLVHRARPASTGKHGHCGLAGTP